MVTVLSEDQVAKDYPIVFIQKNLVSDMNRYAILVPVDELAEYLLSIKSDRVVLEHIYDY